MSDTKAVEMKAQLATYLKFNDIIDEDLLFVMTDLTLWPQDNNLPKISVPIRSSLTQIATYTESVLEKNLYLSDVTFDQIRTLNHEFKQQQSEDLKRERVGIAKSIQNDDHKLPIFTVKPFSGDTLKGSKYIEQVEFMFRNYAMVKFIESRQHCEDNPKWSSAFASHTRDSISKSNILGYLSTELKRENNCADVWVTIKSKLISSDVLTVDVYDFWQEPFGLSCVDMDSFLPFYNSVKKLLHQLKEHKSIAVTDDVFLKSFFAKIIETPELQHEAKKLLKDGGETCIEILDLTH